MDYLCSLWLVETKLVKLLFREAPYTFSTGEDYHLSHMLRKYAGVRSYVLPVRADDRSTWGDTDHTLAYNKYSTGGKKTIELRDRIWWHGVQGGDALRWADGDGEPLPCLLVVLLFFSPGRILAVFLPTCRGATATRRCKRSRASR